MTKPLSVDLRDRVARYVFEGHSRRQAAKVFGVAPSTAIKLVALFLATGAVIPMKQGGDYRSKLKMHGDYILQRVKKVPDITLMELTQELEVRGVKVHYSTLSRFLKTNGFSFKKKLWWHLNKIVPMSELSAKNG